MADAWGNKTPKKEASLYEFVATVWVLLKPLYQKANECNGFGADRSLWCSLQLDPPRLKHHAHVEFHSLFSLSRQPVVEY